jgi:ribosomal protection tetracycline resistance protein
LLRRTLNLGILAHVDAGKTTLTERLLYAAGVIDELGSVDDGSTQTDSLALERQRGITIKSAAVSFAIGEVTVNLIDTPGHPDFIAEVERVLSVLDGAVLVVSAVEGVQAQTRVLMRALQRLRVPTLLFVNKIDRRGADCERVLAVIRERLTPAVVPIGSVREAGTRAADFTEGSEDDDAFTASLASVLAERDDALLAAYVDDEASLSHARLREELAVQSRGGLVHPVFFGSAITGAGVASLMRGIAELLPAADRDVDGPVSGAVFKIERSPAGEKIAYVRMFSGTVHTRDRLRFGRDGERKVTAVSVLEGGAAVQRPSVSAGEIAKLWGLGEIKIGDAIGTPRTGAPQHRFAPPTLETVVVPTRAGDRGTLRVALAQLAEQDPLIDVRQDDVRRELSVSLYGEVQKEVIQATLAGDFGLEVEFRETTTICVERPLGTGEAVDVLGEPSNPFLATVGLRVEPAAAGSGVGFRMDVESGSMPLFVYKAAEHYAAALEDTVQKTLREGLYGWRVTDCTVTLTRSGYVAPSSSARDFRLLTPLVLMGALKQAGTVVCEPIHRFRLELPPDVLGPVFPVLAQLHAHPETPAIHGSTCTLEGEIPAARVHDLRLQVPGLTRGEGVLESVFDRYRPVEGEVPTRPRTDHNPLHREEYLLHLARRVQQAAG